MSRIDKLNGSTPAQPPTPPKRPRSSASSGSAGASGGDGFPEGWTAEIGEKHLKAHAAMNELDASLTPLVLSSLKTCRVTHGSW